MGKHIQIREVSEATHRKLKIRATQEGMSMSDYLKRIIENDLKKPSWEEARERMKKLPPIKIQEATAQMIRRERDSR